MMMVYGMFVFELKTVPHQQLQQSKTWRHVKNERINDRQSGNTLVQVTIKSPYPVFCTHQ